jgi:signal transduction histidine kinase
MLKRAPSLAVRTALIFASIYVATFLVGLVLLTWASLSSAGERHHAGSGIALSFAASEMRAEHGTFTFPSGGEFARLARENPRLWLLASDGRRRFAFGPVPAGARRVFADYLPVAEAAKFHVPGIERPYSDSVAGWRETETGLLFMAAGGVDPETVSVARAFRYLLGQGLFLLAAALALLGLIAMLVALPLLSRALRRVTADAASVGPERPELRLKEEGVPRELLPLVRGFNEALDRLGTELERRRRFIADVAHELRTPLAIVSLQAEALPAGEAKSDMERVLARLSHLVGQMLDVERLSLADPPRIDIDLTALARETVGEMAPLAIGAGYEIGFEAPDSPVRMSGDPQALGRAVANLIGNAIAHGGGRGQIKVCVGSGRTVEVSDEGPGIPESLKPALFEPFQRERWDKDGCGLGLHLTREIMRAHGGDALLLESASGAAFRLQFP